MHVTFYRCFDGLLGSWIINEFWSNISNTMKSVSSDIQTLRSGLKKRGAAEFFYPTSKCLDIWLFRVFDIASQSIDDSWRKSKKNFSESYDN